MPESVPLPVNELRKWHQVETDGGWRFVAGPPDASGDGWLRLEFTDGTNGYYRPHAVVNVRCND